MSAYFTDRVQGAGAIAANAPAPRSAPAPSVARGAGYLAAGAIRIDDPGTDSDGSVVPTRRPRIAVAPPPKPPVKTVRPLFALPPAPAVMVSGSRGATRPPVAIVPTRAPKTPMAPAVPVKSTKLPRNLFANLFASSASVTDTVTKPPPAAAASPKSQTIFSGGGGGGGSAGGAPKSGFSPGLLDQLAPDDEPGIQQSATTAVAPAGGAKLWLVLGLGGTAAYLGYRHFSKKRRGRRS